MRKLFSGLVLFFISCATFADSAWNVSGGPTPVASHTDLSIAYLAQVFGTVGTSLQGTSGQMLGMLFSKLNEGILVVAGLWLIYTIVTIVLRSAMDGSFMGPNKNVFWIIIRIALAFAMLIPGPMTGYNIIQDIVMKVVVEGVSLADQTWNMGLEYIGAGGSLWHRPEATAHSGTIATQSQAKEILSPAQQIFLDEVCMVKSSSINQNPSNNQSSSNSVANTSSSKTIQYNVVTNDTTHTFYFPGVGNSENYSTNLSSGTPGTAYCGSVAWSSIPHANCSSGNTGSCLMAKAAVSQMVYDMLPAAQEYVQNNPDNNILADNSEAFFNSLVNYVNAVMPIAQSQAEGAARKAKRFIPDAMKEGWMMAGRYYWDLSQIQANYSKVSNIQTYVPAVVDTSQQANKTVTAAVAAAKTQASIYTSNPNYNSSQPVSSSNQPGALQLLSHYSSASSAGDTGAGVTSKGNLAGNWILDALMGPLYGEIIGLFALFSTHIGATGQGMGIDPILFLHNVGMRCIHIAGYIWVELALVIFGITIVTTVCQSSLNLDTPIQGVVGWIKTPLMILAAALFGVGVLLGYYIPLYPFMLFIFGVIGWIICVIEAMVAAPLIAFGLTHPEGHDFLGEAKQGLVLLLGIFLRPVLMVIGLIAGMILSYVSLRILVYTYSGFLQDIFWVASPMPGASGSVIESAMIATGNVAASGGSISGLIISLFTFPLMLAVFAALVYVVTTQCFSLIYVLPDYILRWIGGPQNSSAVSAAQMAGQVQGAMGQMASTSSEVGNAALKAKEEDNEKQNEEKNASSSKHKTK